MSHPAFENAGSEPGLEVWTIEKFEPVAVDQKTYGKFYNGDSYIVLKTTGNTNSSLAYDAHFWLGSKTTQDKQGAAAIWTVTLDDMLNGKAVHHREPQGHESAAFLGYFKPAIRYVEGGNESGFTEVETNAGAEKRLLKLSGCDNMRIEEVQAEASVLTKDHCFILEVDHDIFVLIPEGAKASQRRKIISVANTLRDDYHNGRATIQIIDEFSCDDEVNQFFEALGSGSKDDLLSDDGSDTYTRDDISAVYLYRILLGDEIDVVAISKPYKQKQLSSDEVYILDTPDTGVYIWLGSGVDPDTKKNYLDIATKYLEMKGYPTWVSITRVSENSESCNFKQYFHDWETVDSGAIRTLATELDGGYGSDDDSAIAKLIGKSASARGYMPDDGDGNLVIIRLSSGDENVTERMLEAPVLYSSDVYIVNYQYTNVEGDEARVLYLWIGKDADSADVDTAMNLVQAIEGAIENNLTIVRLPQGKENRHFLKIFKGNLAILFGNKDNNYKPENANGDYDDSKIRLFKVEGTTDVDTRLVQVPETADVLVDDDVFILETEAAVYVWHGKESNETEQNAAPVFVKSLLEDREAEVLEQGSEPEEFWAALGGVGDEKEDQSSWKQSANRRVNSPSTLTAVTVKISGKIEFEDLDTQYTQQDLSDDGLYILDTGEELYVWQGKNIPERVKKARKDIVERYIEDDGLDRTADTVLIVILKQGSEPGVFKKQFSTWENDLWENQVSYEELKNQTKSANN